MKIKNVFFSILYKSVPSITILVLFAIILLQRCGNEKPTDSVIYDTIVSYTEIHDTIEGEATLIHEKPDTMWVDIHPPDTSYNKLYAQYISLGNKFYAENTFETIFPIDTFGNVTINDRIKENKLIASKIITDLKIPERIITATLPPTRQIYVGGGIIGNEKEFINGIQAGMLYKDKHDRMFEGTIIYNGQIQYSISSYWKIKLRHK